jgi:hypothetical protein
VAFRLSEDDENYPAELTARPHKATPFALFAAGLQRREAKYQVEEFNYDVLHREDGGDVWLVSMPTEEAADLALPKWADVKPTEAAAAS